MHPSLSFFATSLRLNYFNPAAFAKKVIPPAVYLVYYPSQDPGRIQIAYCNMSAKTNQSLEKIYRGAKKRGGSLSSVKVPQPN